MAVVPGRFRLDRRVALLTGAATGIGAHSARVLAEAGAHVVVTDLDFNGATRLAEAIKKDGFGAEAHMLDVTDEAGVPKLIDAIAALHGRLDILVNNAGAAARVASEDMPTETWEKVIAVNLTGAFRCARAAGRHMLDAGAGAVINISSIMGLVGGALYPNPAYHASKGALVNWTRALALEWAARGVRVNAVAPAFVRTPFTDKLLSDPKMVEAITAQTPLGRLIETREVADAVLFLASDAASGITGVTLPVDGGWTAR
ncbi:MAG TPA: SDR family NAD(P)-dependent oxidoreductase [Alphaproteobacteria bacterium]|nr:SDR family NAD(P)-dependent oxidoreductase [Alphaproteobacteria bacterium]